MANELDSWNAELEEEVQAAGIESLVVYSRDWTVETILSQIEKDNIDLNPTFQRRNAWNDAKRSKLIESLIIGIPVPEIVLAEDKDKKRSFIVIDGKQRLLAIAGFHDPARYEVWDSPKLRGLTTRSDLNGANFQKMTENGDPKGDVRNLMNSDIRCTIISNYESPQVLYDIFYRLNTGSVPLSSQELRQVLNRGEFANYLIATTNEKLPLHDVLNLNGPDARLRDAEILLRYIAFSMFGDDYTGNLTPFLDAKMAVVNAAWSAMEGAINDLTNGFNYGTQQLIDGLGDKKVGRKFTEKGWETRFNRALFEVQVYYASRLAPGQIIEKAKAFGSAIESLCLERPEFVDSIETSTKNIDKYYIRFSLFRDMVNRVFEAEITDLPVPARD
ncbi:DUF262 domain-containing protein [Sphingobium sp. AN558]|uniref:GmrSD restriction endonuclease domain-containing protein n=1 Tax=Sphingobium sp. AN558 TaxID=3133442 RepID=UPI0030BEF5DD